MLQFSSPRLAASHKVAGSTSKVGKRVIVIADSSKRVGHNRLYTSPIVWRFWGRTNATASPRERKPPGLDNPTKLACLGHCGPKSFVQQFVVVGPSAFAQD